MSFTRIPFLGVLNNVNKYQNSNPSSNSISSKQIEIPSVSAYSEPIKIVSENLNLPKPVTLSVQLPQNNPVVKPQSINLPTQFTTGQTTTPSQTLPYSFIPFLGSFETFIAGSKTISNLPPVVKLESTDLFAVVNEGETRKTTLDFLTQTLVTKITSIITENFPPIDLFETSNICLSVSSILLEAPPPSLSDGAVPTEKTNLCLNIEASLYNQPPPPNTLPLKEYSNVCLNIDGKVYEKPPPSDPLPFKEHSNICLSIRGSLYNQPLPSDPLPFKEHSNVCLNIEGVLKDALGLDVTITNVSNPDTSNVCLNIEGSLKDSTVSSLINPPPDDFNVCLGIEGSLKDALGLDVLITNVLNSDNSNICLNIEGSLKDIGTPSLLINPTPDTSNVCLNIEGSLKIIDSSPTSIKLPTEIPNVCLNIEGSLKDIDTFFTQTTLDADTSNVCLNIEGSLSESVSILSFADLDKTSVCNDVFSYITDYEGINVYWPETPPLQFNNAWLFYAPTGITGSNNTKDYVILTNDFLSFRLWNSTTLSFSSVSFETFLNNRLFSESLPDRCIEINRNIFDNLAFEQFVLTFDQGVGQTSNSIGVFLVHPVDQGTIGEVIDQGQASYEVYPIGGKLNTTDPNELIIYKDIPLKIYRLLPPQSPNTPPLTINLKSA
jgi:hypothetical protein